MQNNSKRIGFVDYRLDNFHANTYLAALRGPLAQRGFRVAGATAWHAESSRQWADKHDVPYYESVSELAPHVDYFAVLAPSNADLHFEMCEQVLPHKKPTFVDKTFAPDHSTARSIFELADRHGTAIQTTSALRSTNIQRHIPKLDDEVRNLYVWAGGASFEEYGIHPIELVVSCLGADALEMMRIGPDAHPQFIVRYRGKRTGIIDFSVGVDVDYAAIVTTDFASSYLLVDTSQLFVDAAGSILDFFDAGTPQIDRGETLLIRRIMDLALVPETLHRFKPLSDIPAPHIRPMAAAPDLAIGARKGRA